jgi:Domain of unknown function (DUF6429)
MNKKELIVQLTLMLAYLSAWDENYHKKFGNRPMLKAWKGYAFEVLDELESCGWITKSNTAKSIRVTDAGIKQAEEWMKVYFPAGVSQ